jgi:PadR family transcriptional regulator
MPRRRNISPQTQALLATLLATPRAWRHGYELAQSTRLKSGTLYPLLIRLREQGLLESRWEQAEERGRPPRHAYRLTPNGIEIAHAQRVARAATQPAGAAAQPA